MNEFGGFEIFRGLRLKHIAHLIACSRRARFDTGEILFSAGDEVNDVFLVKSGSVSLEPADHWREESAPQIAGPGSVLGAPSLQSSQWSVTGCVLEPAVILSLSGRRLAAIAQEFPEFASELTKRLANLDPSFADGITRIRYSNNTSSAISWMK